MGKLKSMEERGRLTRKQRALLPEFCTVMAESLSDLVSQLSPTVARRDLEELPLLTLGSQFQGARNVAIGREAIEAVFLAISEIVRAYTASRTSNQLIVRNASGRPVTIALSADPDVRLEEKVNDEWHKKLAIEIKGGTDRSNAYNRAGEAEKSHLKARESGFREFWTIIATKGVDLQRLERDSPTTQSWYDVAQVLGRQGDDWEEFRRRIGLVVGIPVTE